MDPDSTPPMRITRAQAAAAAAAAAGPATTEAGPERPAAILFVDDEHYNRIMENQLDEAITGDEQAAGEEPQEDASRRRPRTDDDVTNEPKRIRVVEEGVPSDDDIDEELAALLDRLSLMFPDRPRADIVQLFVALNIGDRSAAEVADLVLAELNRTGTAEMEQEDEATILFREELEMLKELFPLCDPAYIETQLTAIASDHDRVTTLATELVKNNYPLLKDRLNAERQVERRRQLGAMTFDVVEFLRRYPWPEDEFGNVQRPVTKLYEQHAKFQLYNDFKRIKVDLIDTILKRYHGHYAPALEHMVRLHADITQPSVAKRKRRKPKSRHLKKYRRATMALPEEICEPFYFERLYAKNKKAIEEFRRQKQERFAAARAAGEPAYECACCFDEVSMEDLVVCADGHQFCADCLLHTADVVIGQAGSKVGCLVKGCEREFPLALLERRLPPSKFDLLLRHNQELELRDAAIEGLVACPFCPYATIIPDDSDRVFHCQNPKCMIDSCRLCRMPDHFPLLCGESESPSEMRMRAYVEQQMVEAMIRTCYRCQNRFTKVDGCNHMTCKCGAHMCYICRQPIDGYGHFVNSPCSAIDTADALHHREMKEAAERAIAQYLTDHPQFDFIRMNYNPIDLLGPPPATRR